MANPESALLFDGLSGSADRFSITAPDGWAQGRTLYGGASAAIAVEAACRSIADVPPLRSAQFAFVAPAIGPLDIQVREVRRGKSAIFVLVEIMAEGSPALTALLFFASERGSAFAHDRLALPRVSLPDRCREDIKALVKLPRFAANFDMRLAGGGVPFSGKDGDEILAWVRRIRDEPASNAARLLLLADSVPPAATIPMSNPCPGSTMTWSVDILDQREATGWHLFRSVSDHGRGGYFNQSMTLWDESGRPVVAGRQCVTLYA